jgi:hypothetical protein
MARTLPSFSDEVLFNALARHMKVGGERRQMLLEREGVLPLSQATLALLAELMPPSKDNDRQSKIRLSHFS